MLDPVIYHSLMRINVFSFHYHLLMGKVGVMSLGTKGVGCLRLPEKTWANYELSPKTSISFGDFGGIPLLFTTIWTWPRRERSRKFAHIYIYIYYIHRYFVDSLYIYIYIINCNYVQYIDEGNIHHRFGSYESYLIIGWGFSNGWNIYIYIYVYVFIFWSWQWSCSPFKHIKHRGRLVVVFLRHSKSTIFSWVCSFKHQHWSSIWAPMTVHIIGDYYKNLHLGMKSQSTVYTFCQLILCRHFQPFVKL